MTPAFLAGARARMNARLLGSGTIWRESETRSALGGVMQIFTSIGAVACEVQPVDMSGSEPVIVDGTRRVQTQVVEVPWGTDIRVKDKFITSAGAYDVVSVSDGQTDDVLLEFVVTLI